MTNYEFSTSQTGNVKEDVALNKTINFTLTTPVYISVYAYTLTAYQMEL